MSDASFENLISAYLDNELGAADRARAERLIAEDAELARLLETMKAQSSQLKSLPRYKLNPEFANRLMATDAFRDAFAVAMRSPHVAAGSSGASATPIAIFGKSKNWRTAALAIGALAALILVTLTVNTANLFNEPTVAGLTPNSKSPAKRGAGLNAKQGPEFQLKKGERSQGALSDEVAAETSQAVSDQPTRNSVQQQIAVLESSEKKSIAAADAAGDLSRENLKRDMGITGDAKSDSNVQFSAINDLPVERALDKKVTNRPPLPKTAQMGSLESLAEKDKLVQIRQSQSVAQTPTDNASLFFFAGAPPVEQVIVMTFIDAGSATENYRFGKLRQALADNQIALDDELNAPTSENQGKQIAAQQFGYDSANSEALYVVTSPEKMRGLISGLAANKIAIVSAIDLTADNSISLSNKLSGQPPSSESNAFAIRRDSSGSNSVPDLKARSRVEQPASGGQAGAAPIGAKNGKDALGQPTPTVNEVDTGPAGMAKDLKSGRAAAAQMAELKATSPSNNNNSVQPSFARRVKKSEFRLDDSVFSPGLEMANDRDQSQLDLKAVAGSELERNDSRVAGEIADSEKATDGINEKRNEATARPGNIEDRNIETINRVLGIRSVELGDDQVLRRYLLLVRQAEPSADGANDVAPSADDAPADPADK